MSLQKSVDAWDENKRLTNIANHRVDFRDLVGLDWNSALIFEDRRWDYGETRLIAMAPLGARLHVVVFVERDGGRRIISARKANSREVVFYEKETHPTKG
ncbi:MAG TPA: BrnT family toxin [Roseiarcus sp.]|nr:BrnT family toxin [Roseiarcus sp.]